MKKYALAAACAVVVGFAASAAFAQPLSTLSRPAGMIDKISCDTRNEDKQALCMQGCDDEYIKASQAYSAAGNLEGPKDAKKACETNCGCPDGVK